jgi:hypothetical protein
VSTKIHLAFEITDAEVLKQEKIKAIHAVNKGKVGGFTKKVVTDRIWKYRYLPASLESGYFERNVGDDKELTEIRQIEPVPPYKRSEYNQLPSQTFTAPSFQSLYLT